MKNYTKPQAEINSFITEDIITTSSAPSTPDVKPESLARSGYSIGTVKNLFKN